MTGLRIISDPLTDPAVQALIATHLTQMRAQSPACSVHALEIEALQGPELSFFSAWQGEVLIGCGALKRIDASHGELKSMHILATHRGKGYSRTILTHLEDQARAMGLTRLSLETGSQPEFAPARALYASAGYTECPPFEGYGPDPHSFFMTRTL